MRVLVCGGRNFDCKELLTEKLDGLFYEFGYNLSIISGGARGADRFSIEWAIENGIDFEEFYADWDTHKKAAGPIRNQRMIDEGHPDVCVAFPTPKSRGTWDMIRRCQKHNIPVHIYEKKND